MGRGGSLASDSLVLTGEAHFPPRHLCRHNGSTASSLFLLSPGKPIHYVADHVGVPAAMRAPAGRNINNRVTEYVGNRDIESDDGLGARIFREQKKKKGIGSDRIQKQRGTPGAPTFTLDSWMFSTDTVSRKSKAAFQAVA